MLAQERINEIVQRHRPKGWTVRQSKRRWTWSSAAASWEKKTLYVPTLDDADSLFLYLHEVGHVKQGHFQLTLPKHREEFEAERYALHVLRNEGIPVTRAMIADARMRLCGHIEGDIRKGIAIQPHVARWAKHGGYKCVS